MEDHAMKKNQSSAPKVSTGESGAVDKAHSPQGQKHLPPTGQRAGTTSDAPTDENFVDDDIIEENSHVIPPVRKASGSNGRK